MNWELLIGVIALAVSVFALIAANKKERTVIFKPDTKTVKRLDEMEDDITGIGNTVQEHSEILSNSRK